MGDVKKIENMGEVMENMEKTIDVLKNLVIDLRVEKAQKTILDGHCPYAYFTGENPLGNCDDCSKCKEVFYETLRKETTEAMDDVIKQLMEGKDAEVPF